MKNSYIKNCTACILSFAVMAISSIGFGAGAHPITNPLPPEGFNVGETAQKWQTDFDVTWTAPADMGTDTLIGYTYKWSKSYTAISNTTYIDNESSYDGMIVGSDETPPVTIFSLTDKEIALYDGALRYLHIQTVYEPDGSYGSYTLSTDVVFGPVSIDNTCTGSFRIIDGTGNILVDTQSPVVSLEIIYPIDIDRNSVTDDIIGIWVGEDSNPFTSNPATLFDTYTLQTGAEPGVHTIWVGFKDEVGNQLVLSSSFTLLPQISISPSKATIDPVVTDLKTFSMAGTTGLYDWEIFSETPVNQGDTVAQFESNQSSSIANLHEVVVQGVDQGIFKLRVTNNNGTTWIESETITVLKSSIQFTIYLEEGFNLVSFPLTKKSASIQDVIGNQLLGHFIPSSAVRLYDYDPTTSSFEQYYYYSTEQTTEWRKVGEATATSFQISPDKGYWVNIPSSAGKQQIVFDGVVPSATRTINLVTGFNLVGNAYPTDYLITNSNLVGGTESSIPSSADRIYFYDPSTTQFTQYYYSVVPTTEWRKVGDGSATTDSFVAGQGFWINLKAPLTWNFQ